MTHNQKHVFIALFPVLSFKFKLFHGICIFLHYEYVLWTVKGMHIKKDLCHDLEAPPVLKHLEVGLKNLTEALF